MMTNLSHGQVASSHLEDHSGVPVSPNDSVPLSQKRPRQILAAVSRKAKQDLLDEQVSFVIVTRDNNKPDPYGRESSESGPLSWPAVAHAYNKMFRVGQQPIGSAAMEKRARKHREAWMAERPDYPRTIIYAEKAPVIKVKPQRRSEEQPPGQPILSTNNKQAKGSNRTTVPTAPAKELRSTREARIGNKSSRLTERSSRVSGWVPPDEVRNYDSSHTIEREEPAREPSEHETTAIEVYDAYHNHLGGVHISTRDTVNSSALIARHRKTKASICINLQAPLQAPSITAVGWYAACISPTHVRALPELDILQQQASHDTETTPMGTAYDFAALVDLYNVATVMEDSHVRWLVMVRWQNMLRTDTEIELDASTLERLFANTDPGDQAQTLWATELYSAGLAEEIIRAGDYPDTLVMMLEELVASGQRLLTHT
jgi:hypothetical protein